MRNCACSSLIRFSTRSSAFLPGTGWLAMGDVAAAGGDGVAPCVAGDCEDCAQAARRDRGTYAEPDEAADYRRPGRATAAVMVIIAVPALCMRRWGYRQTRDERRGAQQACAKNHARLP